MMTATVSTKLCWNCEASLNAESLKCPYCGVELDAEDSTSEASEDEELLQAPYKLVKAKQVETPSVTSIEDLPDIDKYRVSDEEWEQAQKNQLGEETVPRPSDHVRDTLVPLSLLLAGSVFFLFGLMVLLFAKDGALVLEWNGDYWFYYLFASLPMLYFGWKSLQDLGD